MSKEVTSRFLGKCFQKDPSLVFRKIEEEMILVPIRRNVGDLESIYTLNEVAARAWELIDGKRSVKDIRDKITEEFEVTDLPPGANPTTITTTTTTAAVKQTQLNPPESNSRPCAPQAHNLLR